MVGTAADRGGVRRAFRVVGDIPAEANTKTDGLQGASSVNNCKQSKTKEETYSEKDKANKPDTTRHTTSPILR